MIHPLLYINIGSPEIFFLFPLLLIIYFVIVVYSLIDITRSRFSDPVNKIVWVIIILFAPLFGAILYLIWGRSQKVHNI